MVNSQQRVAKELTEIINYIKAQHLLQNKTPPSTKSITSSIAKRIKKEELLYEEFINLR